MITADLDLYPSDSYGVRDAIMQAFRSRGIVPSDAQFFSEDALSWPRVKPGALPAVTGLVYGDPNGLTPEEKDFNGDLLRKYAKTNAKPLGFDSTELNAESFHPMFRTDEDGSLKIDMIVEIIQYEKPDPKQIKPAAAPGVRAGVTLMIAQQPIHGGVRQPPQVRYAIGKRLRSESDARNAAAAQGFTNDKGQLNLALLHGGV